MTGCWKSAIQVRGGANEYISAIINVGGQRYYGAVAQPDAYQGTVKIALPATASLPHGSYTMELFSEQRNGDKRSDYVSKSVEVEFEVHSLSKWASNGDDTHSRRCTENGCEYIETLSCGGGSATCTDPAVCQTCESEYGVALNHNWGEWKSNGDDTHSRVCARDNSHTETLPCNGGQATASQKAVCESCGSEYGGLLPPETGDSSNLALWMGLLAVSASAMALLLGRRTREY